MEKPDTILPYTEQQPLATGSKYSSGEKIGTGILIVGGSALGSSLIAELTAQASHYAGVSATFLSNLHYLGAFGMLATAGGSIVMYTSQSHRIIRDSSNKIIELTSKNLELENKVTELEKKLGNSQKS